MNHQVSRHTERLTRGMQAEHNRDKKATQKEHTRPDDATIIVSNPSFFEKMGRKWREKRDSKK